MQITPPHSQPQSLSHSVFGSPLTPLSNQTSTQTSTPGTPTPAVASSAVTATARALFVAHFRSAIKIGILYNYNKRSANDIDIVAWPLRENGVKFLPEEIPEARSKYEIPDIYCFCATADPTGMIPPEDRFKIHIRVCSTAGKNYGYVIGGCYLQENGCGFWFRFDALYSNPKLPCKSYKRRRVPGPGILEFNNYNISIPPTVSFNPQLTDRTPNELSATPDIKTKVPHTPDVKLASPSSSSSSKRKIDVFGDVQTPVKQSRSSTASVASKLKGKCKLNGLNNSYKLGGSANPIIVNSEDEGSIIVLSDNEGSGVHLNHQSRQSTPTAACATINNSDFNEHCFPSERLYGNTYPLANTVERSLLSVRNSDVPLLSDAHIEKYKIALSDNGVPADILDAG